MALYQAIRCADGYITVGAANDRLFKRLSLVLEHPEWADSPEFASNAERMRNLETLVSCMESVTRRAARSHWLERFVANWIPCGPINSYSEALNDPQVTSRRMVVETAHPTLGRVRGLGAPVKLSDTPLDPDRPVPLLGQHTDEILAEIGYDQAAIVRLRGGGAVA